jgi:DNA repair photolyase
MTNLKTRTYELEDNGWSVKGCSIVYAPRGQAGEYAKLATNPYRGCGHACAYCLTGDTIIQMADGSTKQLRDIEVGDAVIGVTLSDSKRSWGTRITATTVLAKIATRKAAYKITLADGTTAVCSADHRWLTERGWKYTADDGSHRPRLTTNNSIRKLGTATLTPLESDAYQVGYVAGMVEGDANLAIYDYSHKRRPSGKTAGVQHRFRLALKDTCALHRTKSYLTQHGIETTDFAFPSDGEPMFAIGTTSPTRFSAIKAMTTPQDDPEWQRGWLAGIFDAEGSHGVQALRIANSDTAILETTEKALSLFGFDYVREVPPSRDVCYIRVRGGRPEHLRFWQLLNPAIKRKFAITGQAINESVKIVSVEPLNETMDMFDIMTGTENFIANGMISHNCYVPKVLKMDRPTFDAGAFPRTDFLDALRKDASKYQALGIAEQVMLSFTTDPYHPGDNSLTRDVLTTLQSYGLGVCTLTKGGSRSIRDIDIFRPDRDAFASTLTTLDDDFSRKWERGAQLPGDRIATLKAFHDAGIFTWVSLEPTLNTESSLAIIEHTHEFVDLYKIGRANYLPMTNTTDWESYTCRTLELVNRLGVKHYIKKDLQPFLPAGYYNPKYINQHHGA